MKGAAWRPRVFACLLAGLVVCSLAIDAHDARADLIGHGAPVRDVALSPDGRFALTAGFDDVAILWRLADESQMARLYGHGAAVNAAAFLPGAAGAPRRAVTVSDDGTGRIWNLETGRTLAVLEGHEKKVVDVAVSPDGRLIATASWDRTVRLWDAETGTALRRFEGHDDSVNAVRFLPDGTRLLSAGYDGTLRTWPARAEGGAEPTLFASAGFPINDMALTADGARVATASADGQLRVWDLARRVEVRRIAAHEGAVLAVAAAPDGRTLATGGTDGRLVLWDADGSATVDVTVDHYRAVWSIAYAPDGATVYASGVDRVTRAWHTDSGAPVGEERTPFQPIERVSRALADSDDPVERGSFHFRKCAVCHSLDAEAPPKAGPTLDGIFGRRVGGLDGYSYSEALDDADFVWTPERVARLFQVGPDVMLPGTKMPIQRLPDPRTRADLIAYLKHATQARPAGE